MEITVIIPLFNRENLIERAINSALAQGPSVSKVLAVDDGSVDGSCKVVLSIQERDSRVELLTKINGGAASARNYGLQHAETEWIAFLDSDDEWLPGRMALLMRELKRKPGAQFVHGNRVKLDALGHIVEKSTRTFTKSDGENQRFLLQHMQINASTVLLKRALLENQDSFFNESLKTCEDYEFWWRLIVKAEAIVYDPSESVLVHQTAGSLVYSGEKNRLRDHVTARKFVLDWLGQQHGVNYAVEIEIFRRRVFDESMRVLLEAARRGVWDFAVEVAWIVRQSFGGQLMFEATCRTLNRVRRLLT